MYWVQPIPKACAEGKVVEIRELGGLHHHYERQAA